MTAHRLSGVRSVLRPHAQRQIEWTGERMVPWVEDPALAYEHFHRYAFAAALADGRRVLDLGSGEGYGAALLASVADEVRGIDIDAAAVRHSEATYMAPNLSFSVGSAMDLSSFSDGEFDLVVCFEVIEHVTDPERVMSEVRRVTHPEGLFLCSTPNRDEYRAVTGDVNPFHVHEMDYDEFTQLTRSRFQHLSVYSQRSLTGSVIYPLETSAAAADRVFVRYCDGRWDVGSEPAPVYLVALASDGPLPAAWQSLLLDPEQQLASRERARADRAERELHEARTERAETEERLQGYMRALADREAEVRELVRVADDRYAQLVEVDAKLARTEVELARREGQLEAIHSSISWQILRRIHRVTRRADGTRTVVGRATSWIPRAIAALARRRR